MIAGPVTQFLRRVRPLWLSRANGRAWVDALGWVYDVQCEAAIEAVKARTARYAPADALPLIARDRQMFRSPTETEEEWRTQLQRASYWHDLAGSDRGIIEQFARAQLTVNVWRHRQMTAMPGYPAGSWSRMWIVIQKPHPFVTSAKWGDGWKWGDGTKWTLRDASPTGGYGAFIKNVLQDYVSPWVGLQGVFVSMDENGLGPLGTNWDGSLTFAGRKIVRLYKDRNL